MFDISGKRILVNRGWAPTVNNVIKKGWYEAAPEEQVHVQGYLRKAERVYLLINVNR